MGVTLLVLAACLLVSSMALISGAVVSVRATRVAPRVTEEVMETHGIVTVPVQRVVQAGRVDVTVRRRILGVIPWKTHHFEDVVDVGNVSGSTSVRRSGGGTSSTYDTETLALGTRAGGEWHSESASGVIGSAPSEVSERLRAFIDGGAERTLAVWWVPWLQNAVGIPFALVTALVLLSAVRLAVGKVAR